MYYACPACGREMTWVPEHGQYYCHACARYFPHAHDPVDNFFASLDRSVSAPPPPPCATCGAPLQFVHEYQRWYCHRCQQYK